MNSLRSSSPPSKKKENRSPRKSPRAPTVKLVWIVGHVTVLYREQADPARRRVLLEKLTTEDSTNR